MFDKDQDSMPPVPEFLRRQPKESTMTTQTKPTAEKKARQVTELPTVIAGYDEREELVIDDLSLGALVNERDRIKQALSDVPRLTLELRAVNQAIRRKAK